VYPIDLHVHTTASDGKHPPSEIVRMAGEGRMKVVAITDHDTVNGLPEAIAEARKFPSLTVIPGVEISTDVPAGEVHVLGYFVNYADGGFRTTFEQMGNARKERAQKIINKLKHLGIHISWNRVQEIAGNGTVGRPHIAEAMLERGYISNFKEAFNKYIGRGCPAYVEWEKMTPVKATELILENGGLPVLAHPLTASDPGALTSELKAAGLAGIEVFYDSYCPEEIEICREMALKNDLIMTGGSDFHGLETNVETPLGGVMVPESSAESLFSLIKIHQANPR